MEEELLRRKIDAQIKKMLTDKWDEGIRLQRDPGPEFLRTWGDRYGAAFHDRWMCSLCKTCKKNLECGFQAAACCDFYIEDFRLDPED